ncbi:DoxX family protein [Corynebacterium stationis]|uniref:DoxX family protein n=1 Tax=Corynebacterium stationis TaxID=1705 RepID=UPI00242EB72C|nr:DoxX family protein [Corynebacterium stationis]
MLRKIARPMLASFFVWDGVDTLRNTDQHVEETENMLARLRKVLPREYASFVPNDPELVARGLAGARVGAGSLLALGKAPRTSAAVLAGTTLPALVGANAFWSADSEKEKNDGRNALITNTALLGALFITAQDLEGKPSLGWRAKKAGERTSKKVQAALPTKSETQNLTGKATDWFEDTTDRVTSYVDDHKDDWQDTGKELLHTAKSYVDEARSYVDDNKDDWQKAGKGLIANVRDTAKDYGDSARGFVNNNAGDWLDAAQDNAKTARKAVVKNASKAQDKADKALNKAEKSSGRSMKKWNKKAGKFQKEADKRIAKAIKKVGKNI